MHRGRSAFPGGDLMLVSIFFGFLAALAAPWLHRLWPKRSGWLCALLPLTSFWFFAGKLSQVSGGRQLFESYQWVPSLATSLSFYLDGLSILFALLILGTGTLVLIYSSAYLKGHRYLGRYYAFMFLFISSMLGLVLADNLLTLFIFWEMTSFSSFLLIGFEHEKPAARKGALQALLVTGLGGLAMLAGFLLLGQAGGSLELSELLGRGDAVRSHALYLPILLLILAGACTKSAQFPFHFWLPSAMEAPTPVSAYLHSATMVKAGIYLLARLSPVMGGTQTWLGLVAGVGATTMLIGAVMALFQKDLKRILAYATVSALGIMTLLLGIGTGEAVKAALVFLLAHAFYKGALFLVAGIVDHETGTRDVDRLGGLSRAMPMVALAAGLAALSMSGFPPFLGFMGKELIYESALHAPHASFLICASVVLTKVLFVAVAALTGLAPFLGREVEMPHRGSSVPFSLWLGPMLLSGLGLAIGFAPGLAAAVISPAVGAVRGERAEIELALWHGVNPVLLLSIATILLGAGVFAGRRSLQRAALPLQPAGAWGPSRCYDLVLEAVVASARFITGHLQNGYLRHYLLITLGAAFLLIFYTIAAKIGFGWVGRRPDALFHEWVIALLILMAAAFAATSRSRLATVAALGVVGYGVALIYILFGAPDLAMTQFCIETLSIILFVLVLYRLPHFSILSGRGTRVRDILIASANGGMMTWLVLMATSEPVQSRIGPFFAQNAFMQAHGRNVVNVILVDFRALDTLGEITVLAVASLGVYALMKGRAGGGGEMIRSMILSSAVRILLPLLLLFSLFLLMRGHNEPGGGFVGGLVAASGFALYALAHSAKTARRKMYIEPHSLVGAGLVTALGSGCLSLAVGRPFLAGLWSKGAPPTFDSLGTPLLFDAGVYLVVMGMALLIIFSLMEG